MHTYDILKGVEGFFPTSEDITHNSQFLLMERYIGLYKESSIVLSYVESETRLYRTVFVTP